MNHEYRHASLAIVFFLDVMDLKCQLKVTLVTSIQQVEGHQNHQKSTYADLKYTEQNFGNLAVVFMNRWTDQLINASILMQPPEGQIYLFHQSVCGASVLGDF